jgi:hypothetical protein
MLCREFVLGETGTSLLRAMPDVLRIRAKERPSILSLIGVMRDESVEPKPGSAAVVTELSTALFTLLLRRLMTEEYVNGSVLALLADTRISRAVDAVLQDPLKRGRSMRLQSRRTSRAPRSRDALRKAAAWRHWNGSRRCAWSWRCVC